MIRFLAPLFFCLVAATAWAETLYVHAPGDGYLNLRTGPGTGYAIAAEMYHGSGVDVLDKPGAWYRVRHPDTGLSGWAHSSYLTHRTDLRDMYVNSPGDGFLNLRTGPTSGAQVIRRMYHGDAVSLQGRNGRWFFLYHHGSGSQGWAHGRYLTGP
ncbi:SH3 domain-containing protein [Pelagovum pacificum]|uniref:SH3 domain-containing protein n=1 Tax=Pelagovum pacificum TaxID=2588711 RepID=A0A5C5G9Y6_9RHOB|nr:SH3 domain-containing protein [Pelagovum pacificum]QQA41538.1 SH3 domain-containing protein [Pelagovum pacificum]TNY30818.1 SH3 domain-containing protein [Pelagovum pacificum]